MVFISFILSTILSRRHIDTAILNGSIVFVSIMSRFIFARIHYFTHQICNEVGEIDMTHLPAEIVALYSLICINYFL